MVLWCVYKKKYKRQSKVDASSFITQMWNQVFHKFADEYQKVVNSMVQLHAYKRANRHSCFTMSKLIVTGIIAQMHANGNCTWGSPGNVLEAFDKVGISRWGINLPRLLQNPLVVNTVNKESRPTNKAFVGVKLPSPVTCKPQVSPFQTPEGVRRGSALWNAHKIRKLELQLEDYKNRPEDVAEFLPLP